MKMTGKEFNLTEDERNTLGKAEQILMDIIDAYDPEELNNCFCRGEGNAYPLVDEAFDNLTKFLTIYDYWRY